MKMNMLNECWAKPSSIYMRKVRHWSCCSVLTPTSKVQERAWLARTWASANIQHYIEPSYSGKGIPPLHASQAPSCHPMASQYRASTP